MVQGGGVDGRDNSGSGILLTESSDISRRIRSNLLQRRDQNNPPMVNRELSGLLGLLYRRYHSSKILIMLLKKYKYTRNLHT